jgi:hypothetical protein
VEGLDASEILRSDEIQIDHTDLLTLPTTEVPLAAPNYLEGLSRSTQDSSLTTSPKKTPTSRRLSQSSRTETSSADQEELQLDRIRKKNRDAATKFRQRQRDLGTSLEAKILELSTERNDLLGTRDSLQSEMFSLTSELNALGYMAQPASPIVDPGLLSPNFDVSYGELLARNAEASVLPQDVALSDLSVSQGFAMDGLIVPMPEEYGFPPGSDPMDHVMPDDET